MFNYKRKKYQNDSPTLSRKEQDKKNLLEKIKVKEHEHMN